MEFLTASAFFAFGAVIGSFLNVLILRFNTGATLGGRSKCFSCGRVLRWYDLVPVLSFFFLRGRCRFCKSKISVQYPIVELVTGLLFLGVFLKFIVFAVPFSTLPFTIFTFDLFILSLLVVIGVYDLKHKIIPDWFAYSFAVLSLVKILLTVEFSALVFFPHVFDLIAGPAMALPLFLLWFVSSGRWIGLGDSKLALGIGWFLGFSQGVSAVIIGFWIGAVVGLSLVGFAKLGQSKFAPKFMLNFGLKNLTLKSEIPFAPFLILGLLVVYFSGIDVMGFGALGI